MVSKFPKEMIEVLKELKQELAEFIGPPTGPWTDVVPMPKDQKEGWVRVDV